MIAIRQETGARVAPSNRAAFLRAERKLRSLPQFAVLDDALTAFESAYFCTLVDGKCARCGRPAEVGGPLCGARFEAKSEPDQTAEIKSDDRDAVSAEEQPPASDPLLDFFKIPYEPGEISGFEYDALIDSAPVIVWRPTCEIEADFVGDMLYEAAEAGVKRVFLIARTEMAPDKLPMHPNVALILLPIPPSFSGPTQGVIETDEVVYS
ncbi:MAG: hypothetical protein IPN69_06190 [Acidobacteria bacterium]|nr:hypothetical protein [Acidobacteriota bacterium]